MELDEILEKDTLYSFYGVHDHQFKIGNLVFEALEDEADGYRSYLETAVVVDKTDAIFSERPLVNVYLKSNSDNFELIDEEGHCWLIFGTDHTDDYYPYFYFSYAPRKYVYDFAEPLDNFDPINLHPEKLI